MDPATTQATFCATLVDEWARTGVRHAVLAPGSRSTPLALALATDDRIDVQVFLDERCAAFAALGVGVATGVPAVVVCTSGTAATHFHAAVVEAHHSRVPLLAVTADRPPELRDVGAPQTIDQQHLFGRAVRWFADPGVADEAMRSSWRSLAARAVAETRGQRPGPVHLNLPFREPLVAEPAALPPGRDDGLGWQQWRVDLDRAEARLDHDLARQLLGRCGVVVAGARAGSADDIERVAVALGWPVLADPRSGYAGPNAVHRADALLRSVDLSPEVVLRLGAPPASKVLAGWCGRAELEIVVGDEGDPGRTARALVAGDAGTVAQAMDDLGDRVPAPDGWLDRWLELDGAAEDAIAKVLAEHDEPNDPATARHLLASLPAGAHLVAASSMPVRDLEWYATARPDVTVHSNRGANGIDGTISTAIGVALATGAPTAVLLGDVAFLHDAGALVGIAGRGVDLTIAVLDNDGGGIFSFLPQALSLAGERFEQLFGTPHGLRPEHVAAGYGVGSMTVEAADAVALAVQAAVAAGGVHLVVARTDRAANKALHDELNAAVAAAVSR